MTTAIPLNYSRADTIASEKQHEHPSPRYVHRCRKSERKPPPKNTINSKSGSKWVSSLPQNSPGPLMMPSKYLSIQISINSNRPLNWFTQQWYSALSSYPLLSVLIHAKQIAQKTPLPGHKRHLPFSDQGTNRPFSTISSFTYRRHTGLSKPAVSFLSYWWHFTDRSVWREQMKPQQVIEARYL